MTATTDAITRRTEEVQLPSTIDVRYGTELTNALDTN
ncbi:MAG: hypothetical protein ACI90V_008625 [Bacillariaceae sp.]|jgi:hypothetical protein